MFVWAIAVSLDEEQLAWAIASMNPIFTFDRPFTLPPAINWN
jgi:hypothetical protein